MFVCWGRDYICAMSHCRGQKDNFLELVLSSVLFLRWGFSVSVAVLFMESLLAHSFHDSLVLHGSHCIQLLPIPEMEFRC